MNILLGVTGSITSAAVVKFAQQLQSLGTVRIVLTDYSKKFLADLDFGKATIKGKPNPLYIEVLNDEDEWVSPKEPILRIELRSWADIFVIVTNETALGQLANGLCDNLLTSVVRCWDMKKKIYLAPSMHDYMWNNSISEKQTTALSRRDFNIIPPQKTGALVEAETIVKYINQNK